MPMRVSNLPADVPRVIGITGRAGAGKSTVAEILQDWGFRVIHFADPLKAMLAAFLDATGMEPAHVAACLHGDLKETPCPELMNRTPRHAMQTLGTEWGRSLIALDLWEATAARRITSALHAGHRVAVPDVRFANEAAMVERFGGQVWRVDRPAPADLDAASASHASEKVPGDFAALIENTGTLDDLESRVLEILLG